MTQAFQDLGATIDARWQREGRREDAFVEIATTELADSKVLTSVEPGEIAVWLMRSDGLPEQKVSNFGQPPVTMYKAEDFYIEALYWLDSTTSVHEHAFTGAFGVLHGSSIQTTYAFKPEKIASDRVVVGEASFLKSELLSRGDIRPIHHGDRLIHALFHLDRPSVSVVVRTSTKMSVFRPQYNYLKPYLALDDFEVPNRLVIQTRLLDSLAKTDVSSFWKAARVICSHGDPFTLFRVLSIAFPLSLNAEEWNGLLDNIGQENRWLLPYILPCLRERERTKALVSLRSSVHDPTLRFFLALLLNVPRREDIYKLIAERFPDRAPESLVLEWLAAIFKEEHAGLKLSPSMLYLLGLILQDREFEHSRPILRDQFRCEKESDLDRIKTAWISLQAADILRPLMKNAAVPA